MQHIQRNQSKEKLPSELRNISGKKKNSGIISRKSVVESEEANLYVVSNLWNVRSGTSKLPSVEKLAKTRHKF